jgi:hypothetical protein
VSKTSVTAKSFGVDATISPTSYEKLHDFKLELIEGTIITIKVNTGFLVRLHEALGSYLGKK